MATDTTTATARTDGRLSQVGFVRGLFRRVEIGALIGAVAVWILFAAVAPQNWVSIVGVARILDPASTLGIMAIAVALLMIGGEFDLSTGVMTGTTGLIAGLLATRLGWNLWPSMGVAFVIALLIGFLNGIMVVKTGLPSFIVTLATFFVLRGVNVGGTLLVTNQVYVGAIDTATGFYSARSVFNVDFTMLGVDFRSSTFWWIVVAIIASWIMVRTKYGSWIYATGGDANAARNAGVPAARVKIALFMTTAAAGWLVGMMNIVRLRSAVASQGIGQEFVYIIAATIGGCLLTGGYGSVIGASIGALIFGMAQVGIVFAGWNSDWFYSFLGVMLLGAVIVNRYTRKRAEEISLAAAKARTEG